MHSNDEMKLSVGWAGGQSPLSESRALTDRS
jgi:hypothetical protein